MPKRRPRPDALPVTPPEPPRLPFALAIVRDGLVNAALVSRQPRRQMRAR
ncbi:MAG TPA: hypothetical protein VGS01_11115 [Candidatus Limnocylindria bacterium]|jgi:hypothetical protein|nr:hypothetical protein [Candidatus Limnocylindria bacterium]